MSRLRQVMILLLFLTAGFHSVSLSSSASQILDRAVNALSITPTTHRHKYARGAEVQEKCPALTLREEQSPSESGKRRPVLEKLSFVHGDWEQAEPGASPILPFSPRDPSQAPSTEQLASFFVTDVARSRNRVRQVSGVIQLTIVEPGGFRPAGFSNVASVDMSPGLSALNIEVEGIYQPTENEDVVCLLGCALLPEVGGEERDCNIMVQLHYPLTYNLTSRVIRGTIQSLVAPGEKFDFSPISLSAALSGRDAYETTAGEVVDSACSSSSSEALVSASAFEAGSRDFCWLAGNFLSGGSLLDIEPNWNCNVTREYCGKIGPFASHEEHRTSQTDDYNKSRAQILVQDSHLSGFCYSGEELGNIDVSFVLRLVPADGLWREHMSRNALDGQTLVAEGNWKNDSSTICMVACQFDDSSGQPDLCNAKITLQIPLSLSIKRRNIFEGRISSLLPKDHADSFFPVDFYKELDYDLNYPFLFSSRLSYNYTMLDDAGAVLSQHEPESNRHKVPWSKYPALIGEEKGHYKSLAADLSFANGLKAVEGQAFSFIDFDVVAMDEYLPFLWNGFAELSSGPESVPIDFDDTIVTETNPKWTHRRREARKYMNCSATMSFIGHPPNSSDVGLKIFAEGYYSPMDGKMYMVGCRDIKASWQNIKDESYDLNEGMDCEIEVLLEYPTTLVAWLLNPGVRVKVHSNRPVDDMFHFTDIDTETYPMLYKKQRESIVSRKSVELALSIVTLSLMLACIFSQLLYIESHPESTPYISLVMLGVQAMEFAIPLVTGAESLLARKFEYRNDYLLQQTGSAQMVVYLDKILTLVALLFLLRLFEKVWRERTLFPDLQQQPARVPQERNVAVICFIIHALGFLSVMALHSRNSVSEPVRTGWAVDSPLVAAPARGSNVSSVASSLFDMSQIGWHKVLQEYAGLVEDLFLLPQAIAFSLWDVSGKPLRFVFFAGLTVLQIVPHVYDYLRDPGLNGYSYTMYANPSFDFYTNVGNILIPVLALLLALLVYCQQRWNGFLRFPKRFLYQQLAAKNSETELMVTNGRNHLPPIPEDDE